MRVLSLLIVFALASTASAELADIMMDIELWLVGGTTVQIRGIDPGAESSWTQAGVYVADGYDGTVSGPLNSYPAAGDLRAIHQWTGWNGVDFTIGQGMGDPMTTGVWFDFQFTGATAWPVYFDVYDYTASTTAPAVGQLPLWPEPTTLALLALGGVAVLRRRRK